MTTSINMDPREDKIISRNNSERIQQNKANGESDGRLEKTDTAETSQSQDNGDEKKRNSPPTWKSYITVVFLFAGYVCLNLIGAAIFRAIEKTQLDGKLHPFGLRKVEFVKAHGSNLTIEALNAFLKELDEVRGVGLINATTIHENQTLYADRWTLNEGFLLSFTIASTIGYGVLTPRTEGGQMFAIFYALISIPFTGLLAAKLGSILAYFIKKAGVVLFRDRKSNRWIKTASILFTFLLGLFFYIIIPSLVLAYVDAGEKWTFVESLYCIFITLTTIGFGDYVPDPHATLGMAGPILVLMWVVAGLAWVATIVNLIATTISKKATSIKKRVANQHISIKTFKSGAAALSGQRFSRKVRLKASNDSLEKGAKFTSVDPEQEDDETPRGGSRDQPNEIPSSADPRGSIDYRRESKSSKRDSVLGPNVLMSLVVNNMETYQDPTEMVEEND